MIRRRCASPGTRVWSRHSRRVEPKAAPHAHFVTTRGATGRQPLHPGVGRAGRRPGRGYRACLPARSRRRPGRGPAVVPACQFPDEDFPRILVNLAKHREALASRLAALLDEYLSPEPVTVVFVSVLELRKLLENDLLSKKIKEHLSRVEFDPTERTIPVSKSAKSGVRRPRSKSKTSR